MKEELLKSLHSIALKKTQPFCYSCYQVCLSGICDCCGSDDLMRHMDGAGVEWGTDWVIEELISENLTPIDIESAYDEYLSECYPEATEVGWIEIDTISALKIIATADYEISQSDWVLSEEDEGFIISFDNGSTYYQIEKVQKYINENE